MHPSIYPGDWNQQQGPDTGMKQKGRPAMYKPASHAGLWGLCCAVLVKEDCRRNADPRELRVNEEALFCTLCNVEVILLI